jgi:hypothetical protein
MRKLVALWLVGILALAVGPGWAATWYVDIKTCPSTGGGTLSSPYCDIQLAIDRALAGDTVKVAAGTYSTKQTRQVLGTVPVFPNPATAVVWMRDQVHLEGAGIDKTILNAGGADRVAIFNMVNAGTRFQGFTVTGGDTTERVGDGAGLLVLSSSPTITQNRIVGNHAFFGGGIEVLYSAPLIQDNVITQNTAGSDIQSATGGGIDVAFGSDPLITRNVIVGNYVHGSGGGVAFYETNARLDSNCIEGNVAELNGGGVYSAPIANQTLGTVLVRSNIISLNVARGGDGAGVFASEGTDVLTNTISHNRAVTGYGGGIFTLGSLSITLRDNLIVRNGAVDGGGVYFDPTSNPQVAGNDVIANLPYNFGGASDPTGTQGNFSAEPVLGNVPAFVADVQIDRFHALVTTLDTEPTRQFAVGDLVEYGNDGVRRVVTLIRTAVGVPLIKLETSPILTDAEILLYPVVLRNWKQDADLREEYGVSPISPVVDAASGNGYPPTDARGHMRAFDGDLNGQIRVDVGGVESLAELPRLGIAADSRLVWQPYAGRPWHYHLYRGLASDLVDANKDGLPDGPDHVPGTFDDGYGQCLAVGVELPGPDYLDPETPPPGQAFFYLGSIMASTEGILGYDSAGRERKRLFTCD